LYSRVSAVFTNRGMDPCVETLPTDWLDGFLSSPEDVRESEDNRPVCWGRMFPLGSSCTAFGMLWCTIGTFPI